MVARTPPKERKMVAPPLNPVLLRETIKKMDRCMARLEELQCTVTGGKKVISGVSLSPRSTRVYLRTSLRCKQESLRIKSSDPRKSPVGKFPASTGVEWRRMSLPAMLLGETVGEILKASSFAKEIAEAVNAVNMKATAAEDPMTPVTKRRRQRPQPGKTELQARRNREKQNKLQLMRSELGSPPSHHRARSRINFRVSPPTKGETEKPSNARYLANRVSPRNRPWAKKTVLFPNPLFLSTPSSQQQKFSKTRSPIIPRKRETPHKFLIKSPSSSKFQVKIKSPPKVSSLSPPRPSGKKSSPPPPPKMSTASKLRRSFSPSRLATRLVSPLKGRKSVQKSEGLMSGLKQRPTSTTPMRFAIRRV